MRSSRKSVYLTAEQQRKVCRLAQLWGCSEAEVIRQALERLPGPDGIEAHRALLEQLPAQAATALQRLAAAGLLAPPLEDADLPTDPAEIEALEQEYEAWVDSLPEPLGLAEAVMEDRR